MYSDTANPRAALALDGGGLTAPIALTLAAVAGGWSGSVVGFQGTLVLQPQLGIVRGFVRDPANGGRKLNIRGIILQKQNAAAGYFESGSGIGEFTLSAE